jgi:hypothetical protein
MEQQLTHWKKIKNPNFIGAHDLMDGSVTGRELVVTVGSVERKQVIGADGKSTECTVCNLVGVKPMILNSTNQKTMQKLFGSPYIEMWAGKKMTLYVAKTFAFGETVDGLRVRKEAPKEPTPTLPELTPTSEHWNRAKQAITAGTTTVEAIRKSFTLTAANEALLTAK